MLIVNLSYNCMIHNWLRSGIFAITPLASSVFTLAPSAVNATTFVGETSMSESDFANDMNMPFASAFSTACIETNSVFGIPCRQHRRYTISFSETDTSVEPSETTVMNLTSFISAVTLSFSILAMECMNSLQAFSLRYVSSRNSPFLSSKVAIHT